MFYIYGFMSGYNCKARELLCTQESHISFKSLIEMLSYITSECKYILRNSELLFDRVHIPDQGR